MPDDMTTLLQEISHKLDELIVLGKLSNLEALREYSREVNRDKVARAIVEVAREPSSYSDIVKKTASKTSVSERTVKSRISELNESGVLIRKRVGREVYYERSDLFMW